MASRSDKSAEHSDARPIRQGFLARAVSRLTGRQKAVGAGVGAVAATAALVLATMSAAVAATNVNVTDASYPAGTTAIADPSTMDGYTTYPTGSQTTSYDTTEFAGRLWTDKTVVVPTDGSGNVGTTATFDLASSARDLDGEGTAAEAGKYQVDKTASGTFLTSVSVLSSSLEVSSTPVPLDIVLVLDVSGSMNYSFGAAQDYYPVYNNYTDDRQIVQWGGTYNSSTPSVYMKNADGTYTEVYEYYYQNRWTRSNALYNSNEYDNYRWYTGSTWNSRGTQIIPRTSGTDTDATHTQLYVRRSPTRMDALKNAVNGFIDTIAEVNDSLPAEYQNRIAVVKFAGTISYTVGNSLQNTTKSPLALCG